MCASQRGAVSVLIALLMPALVVFLSFVVDFANGVEHQRHLQLQADAAVLAGGQAFAEGTCSDADVVGRALQYSTVQQSHTNWTGAVSAFSDPSSPYNAQIGGTPANNMYEAINSSAYLPAGNTAPADQTGFSGSPCADNMLDIKITETNLPWYFQAGGFHYLNAHARLAWQETNTGFIPLAVDENTPQAVAAYFVDESGNQVGNAIVLTNQGPVGTGLYSTDGVWTNPSASVPVTVPGMSMVLALSGNPHAFDTGPSLATACAMALVQCLDGTGSGDHLVHIQGYSTSGSGSPSAPIVRSVQLPQAGSACSSSVGPDSYFSKAASGSCNVLVRATIDFGSNPNPSGVKVWARLSGTNNCSALQYNSSAGSPYAGSWTGTLPIAAGSGANQVDIVIASSCNKNSTAKLADAQSAFGASSANAGPIDGVILSQGTGEAPNSYPMCATCSARFAITADIAGSLQNFVASPSNPRPPIFALNFGSNNTSSQTGLIECPPNSNSGANLAATLVSGCSGQFTSNGSTWGPDPNCTYYNPLTGGSPPPPADCVQTKNGVTTGNIDQGLYCRLVGGSQCVTTSDPTGAPPVGRWYCPAEWNPNVTNPPDNIQPNDDRLIGLFVTPYDSFTGSGSQLVPILYPAYFYVMGFSAGGHNADPCSSDTNTQPASGRVWGYFVKRTTFGGVPGDVQCKQSALGACQIVLTK
jgi:Putative Flp pilus-assembly TadE/G-like